MRILTAGFELGEEIEHNGAIQTTSEIPVSVTTSPVKTGDYALKIDTGGRAYQESIHYFSQVLDSNLTELYFRVALRITNSRGAGNPQFFLALADGTTVQMAVGFQTTDQRLVVRIGGTGEMGQVDGTADYTGSAILTADQWFVVEGYVKLSNAAAGEVVLRVNGVTDLSQSGIDTAVTANGVGVVRMGASASGGYKGFDIIEDDWALNDTTGTYQTGWPGSAGVYLLRPVADGDGTAWAVASGSVHWDAVDDVPDGTANYIYSQTAGEQDLFELGDLPTDITDIVFVQPVYQAALGQAGQQNIVDLIKAAGTVYEGSTAIVTTVTPNYILEHGEIYNVNPSTGATWTVEEVNALQSGVEVAP